MRSWLRLWTGERPCQMRGRVCGVNFGLFFDLGLMAGSEVELFFFVVAGEEDPIVLAETVYEPEKCVWGRTHRREDSGSM